MLISDVMSEVDWRCCSKEERSKTRARERNDET